MYKKIMAGETECLLPDPGEGRLFTESYSAWLSRVVLGTLRALHPSRIQNLACFISICISYYFYEVAELPNPTSISRHSDGLCGFTNELATNTIIEAYRTGLHPGGHCGPIKWYCPPMRCVLLFDDIHIARRLKGYLRKNRFHVTFDQDFENVILNCAAPRKGKLPITWITPKIMAAYSELFDAGVCHSFEVWNESKLVGGGYGIVVGRIFSIESLFSWDANASKIGLLFLNWHLKRWGFALADNKTPATHCLDMGFKIIERDEYLKLLRVYGRQQIKVGRWQSEAQNTSDILISD